MCYVLERGAIIDSFLGFSYMSTVLLLLSCFAVAFAFKFTYLLHLHLSLHKCFLKLLLNGNQTRANFSSMLLDCFNLVIWW